MEKLILIINNKLYLRGISAMDEGFWQGIIDRIYTYEEILEDKKLIEKRRRMTAICDGNAFLTKSVCFDGKMMKRLIAATAKYEYLLESNNLITFKKERR